MKEFIDWTGGPQPFEDMTFVEVVFRDKSADKDAACCYDWSWGTLDLVQSDIVAYRFLEGKEKKVAEDRYWVREESIRDWD